MLMARLQVMSGVAHMHSQGYVHRDMKPENILLVGEKHPPPQGRAFQQQSRRFKNFPRLCGWFLLVRP